ncbi:MAG: cbb3-type cytochrome oxidase assembly protein [Candidatus Eisenbacteria bacterium]|uniref:Cbb3-type cytochrome oxidase assembly protein n=1 Tax=Eiseniibacteriota bacterium TaxID=2212470 RepID=A0A956NK79_UNCEI|nr:cbb3-type cytochrome oxidase assembly protein [Candidatus Eisenbacteria bacterium]MCB9464710.1 cbb3-type cytochrome oxidase assembly protein [Candidatus Eisenbacteria bacterium]
MDVLIILLFISLVFVTGAVLLFLRGVTSGDFEQGDRVSLLPLEPDSPSTPKEKAENAMPPTGSTP